MIGRFLAILLVATLLAGCARPTSVCGVTYDSYGLLNEDGGKNPDVQYRVVWGNVIWSVILAETVIAPIYFFGFSIFEPIGPKSRIKGAIGAPQTCPPSTDRT